MSGIMQFLIGALSFRVSGQVSYTSSGTYSWICPGGVFNVSVTGAGGVNGVYYTETPVSASNFVDGYYLTYSGADCFGEDVGTSFSAEYNSRIATCQAFLDGITSSTYTNYSVPGGYYMYCSSTFRYLRYVSNIGAELARIGGTLYRRTSSSVNGQNSTAFGYTFAANAGPSTYSGVSVSPGTSYTIVVGAGGTPGYVTIEY